MKLFYIFCLLYFLHNAICRDNESPVIWTKPRYAMPWIKGPNVCAVEEVIGSGKRYYTDCMAAIPRQICGKKTFVRYHCCTGYEEAGDGSSGCRGVRPVRSMMNSLESLNLHDLKGMLERSGLSERLQESGPFTLFAPERRALEGVDAETRSLLTSRDQQENLLRLHVTEDRHFTKALTNDQTLQSLYYDAEQGRVKINRYSNGVLTANCVRIALPDQVASNGVIHITENVLAPYPSGESVMDRLMKDQRFGELVTALIISDVGNTLRNIEAAAVTIFAPTDSAFRRASPELISRLFEDESKELMRALLKYHIIEHQICAPAILGPYSYRSREGQVVNLTCDVNDRFLVNGIPVSDPDIVANNGVIHVIEELLIPDSVKTVEDLLLDLDLGQFQEYAQQAGLGDILSGRTKGNFTYFVPSAEAFRRLSPQQFMRIQTDSATVRQVFSYHVTPERVSTRDMSDGQALTTLAGPPLRSHIYQKDFGVNSALIVNPNNEAGNGVIHVIDRVLFPPDETAMEIIKEDPRLSTFASLLQTSGLDVRLDRAGHYTILAPSNAAINRLPTAFTEMLMLNEEELRKALSYHLLHKPVFTTCLQDGLRYRYHSLSDDWLYMEKPEGENNVLVNSNTRVQYPDIESTSGVIHIIDDVLQCPCVEGFQNWGV